MKLLMVTPYFYPKIGGLENYALQFALQLKKKFNMDVVVVTSNHKSKENTKEIIQGITVYRLAPLFVVSNTPIHPLWLFKIKRIIKQESPDIINAHTPVPYLADIAAIAAESLPFILTYHAYSLYKESTTFNILIKFYKFFEHFLFKRADKIVAVSEIVKDSFDTKIREKTIVVYNSISRKELYKGQKSYQKKSAIFIGKIDKTHDWKGLSLIIKALKLANKKISLSVIGTGNNLKFYQEMVKRYKLKEYVTFHGEKINSGKKKLLRKSSFAIIYPKTSNDAFPTVGLEYWANKIPVISADITPLNKIFKHNKTAFFAKPNNPQDLALKIDYLMRNKKLLEKLSRNGFKEVKTKYILENESLKLYSIIKNLL